MSLNRHTALAVLLTAAVGLAACGDNAETEDAASPTPPENLSEAEPEGVGGTSND